MMGWRSIMESKQTKINIMGSEVVEGFVCKPKKLDPNKPMMHFKTHLFICNDERCAKACKQEDLATYLRNLLKTLELHRGENRIKISRTGGCFGACRFRAVANIYENTQANGYLPNNNIWLKNTHLFTKDRWIELFKILSENKKIDESNFEQISMAEYL